MPSSKRKNNIMLHDTQSARRLLTSHNYGKTIASSIHVMTLATMHLVLHRVFTNTQPVSRFWARHNSPQYFGGIEYVPLQRQRHHNPIDHTWNYPLWPKKDVDKAVAKLMSYGFVHIMRKRKEHPVKRLAQRQHLRRSVRPPPGDKFVIPVVRRSGTNKKYKIKKSKVYI